MTKEKNAPNDTIMCPIHSDLHPIYIEIPGIMGAMAKDSCLRLAKIHGVCVLEVIKDYEKFDKLSEVNK